MGNFRSNSSFLERAWWHEMIRAGQEPAAPEREREREVFYDSHFQWIKYWFHESDWQWREAGSSRRNLAESLDLSRDKPNIWKMRQHAALLYPLLFLSFSSKRHENQYVSFFAAYPIQS
jgi:hypothetical protein